MGHGQLGKLKQTDQGKETPRFHTTEISYINFFPQKIDQISGIWAGQGLKLRRNTSFCRFKSSLAVNFHVPKPEMSVFSKMSTSIFCLSKGAHMTTLLANQLGQFEYSFRCLKRFFRKMARKLRSPFFHKLRFLKTRLLVT